jgi:hypothetical protein
VEDGGPMMEGKCFVSAGFKKTAFLLDPEDQFKLFKKFVLPEIKRKVGTQISAQRMNNKIKLIVNGHVPEVDIV